MFRKRFLSSLLVLLSCLPVAVYAHKPSDSYLSLDLSGPELTAQWDIALRDLEFAIGLDTNQDRAITWGELRAAHAAIADYALSRLQIRSGTIVCPLQPQAHLVDEHSDGSYEVLRFNIACPNRDEVLSLHYSLFFDLDPSHRGLLRISYPDGIQTAVLSPEQPELRLDPLTRSGWRQFGDYWREGVWHIWIGFDHILFLLALLLPVVLWREQDTWRSLESFWPAFANTVTIVTAFTVAHSITLTAAVLGWIQLPSRLVESAIAATVVLAAGNNLYPLIRKRVWLIAFCLGLIHGFGFASVLMDLGLPGDALLLALAGFNLGVETGQLAIVVAFLPLAYLLRNSWFYRHGLLQLGSCAVAIIAGIWLLERSLNLSLSIY